MGEPRERVVVDGIDVGSLVHFPRILRAVLAALQPARLVLALLMVVILIASGRAWDALAPARVHPDGLLAGPWSGADAEALEAFLEGVVASQGLHVSRTAPHDTGEVLDAARRVLMALGEGEPSAETDAANAWPEIVRGVRELAPRGAFESTAAALAASVRGTVRGVIDLRPLVSLASLHDGLVRTPIALWKQERIFVIVYGLLVLLVASLGGGAISRMAACDLAGEPRLSPFEAVQFALENALRLVLALALPGLIAGAIALIMLALGMLMLPWADVLGGALYGLALLLGFLLAFVLVGYALGAIMLVPAAVCERCDPAEAQQRAYAYLLGRPLHYLGYGVVAIVGLALGYCVVAAFAAITLNATAALVGGVSGTPVLSGTDVGVFHLAAERDELLTSWHHRSSAVLVGFWERIVIDLVAAWVVSYLFSAATAIYLLMRRACDGQEIDEIWRPGLIAGTSVPAAE